MKTSRVSLLLLAPAFAFGLALEGQELAPQVPAPVPAPVPAEDQAGAEAESQTEKQKLEARLQQLEQRIAALEIALRERGEAADEMRKSLELVEKQGFTAGINYKSRITLLAALRDFAAAMKKPFAVLPAGLDTAGPEKGEGAGGEPKK